MNHSVEGRASREAALFCRSPERSRGGKSKGPAGRSPPLRELTLTRVFGCFRPPALVFAKLRCRKGASARAASPACKCAGQQARPIIGGLGLVRTHRQNQLPTALRTFTFLHNPRQNGSPKPQRPVHCSHTMAQMSRNNWSMLTALGFAPLLFDAFGGIRGGPGH